jgi:hypothetical protein
VYISLQSNLSVISIIIFLQKGWKKNILPAVNKYYYKIYFKFFFIRFAGLRTFPQDENDDACLPSGINPAFCNLVLIVVTP